MTDQSAIERGVALVGELKREVEIGRKHDRWPMFPGPHCETIIAALEAAGEMVGEKPGWKLVPVEPTEEMLRASRGAIKALIDSVPKEERKARFRTQGLYSCLVDEPEKSKIRYKAMLAAVPATPASHNKGSGCPHCGARHPPDGMCV